MTGIPDADAASRRKLLRAAGVGLAAGGTAWLVGCGHSEPPHAHVPALQRVPHADVPLLQSLLDVKYQAIFAYTAGIPLLDRPAARPARRILSHELSHAGELAGLIKKAHVKPRRPKPSYDLGHPATQTQVLSLLQQVEDAQLTAFLHGLPGLEPGPIRSAIAAILSNDAQHLAIIRQHLGQQPVPSAFLTARA